jgi:DNA-binding transcriptional ArsR family regulator
MKQQHIRRSSRDLQSARRPSASIACTLDLRVQAMGTRRRFRASQKVKKQAGTRAQALARAIRGLRDPRQFDDLAALLASLGSIHRLRILYRLLEAPASYRQLQLLTGLQAGPVYHHVDALRAAGLVGPKRRDVYQLTEWGVQMVLAAGLLMKINRSKRLWTGWEVQKLEQTVATAPAPRPLRKVS